MLLFQVKYIVRLVMEAHQSGTSCFFMSISTFGDTIINTVPSLNAMQMLKMQSEDTSVATGLQALTQMTC